jgi:hypothetical protein
MKSRFGFWSYFHVVIGLVLAALIAAFVVLVAKGLTPAPSFKVLPLVLVLTFTLLWLFWGECRTKMIVVTVDGDILSVRRFGGLGRKQIYLLSGFDGFTTSQQSYGARGILEYLYLKKGATKVVKLSETYHQNYQVLKAVISSRTKDLGIESFSFVDEVKEIFV